MLKLSSTYSLARMYSSFSCLDFSCPNSASSITNNCHPSMSCRISSFNSNDLFSNGSYSSAYALPAKSATRQCLFTNVTPNRAASVSPSPDVEADLREQATSIRFMKSSERGWSVISMTVSELNMPGRLRLRMAFTSWMACLLVLNAGSSVIISSRRWAGILAKAW